LKRKPPKKQALNATRWQLKDIKKIEANSQKEDTRLEITVKSEVSRLETKLVSEVSRLETKLVSEVSRLETVIERGFKDQLKWLIILLIGFSSLILAVIKLL
jgi:hypothetical protein